MVQNFLFREEKDVGVIQPQGTMPRLAEPTSGDVPKDAEAGSNTV
jgi:hypothetical protein